MNWLRSGTVALVASILLTSCSPFELGDDYPSSSNIGVAVTEEGDILLVGRFCSEPPGDTILIYPPGGTFADEPVTVLKSSTGTIGDYAISLNMPEQFGYELVRGTRPDLTSSALPARIAFSVGERGAAEWVTIEELPPPGWLTFADGGMAPERTIRGSAIPPSRLCTPED